MGGLRDKLMPSTLTVLCGMVFAGQICNYMMRINLSLLIVDMVKSPPANDSSSEDVNKVVEEDENDKFDWDEITRGHILSAFNYGYVTTQIVGGRLTEVFGIKKVYGFSLLATAVLSLLSPAVAKLHYIAFIVLRIAQGVFEGVTFPALLAMIARWVHTCICAVFKSNACLIAIISPL